MVSSPPQRAALTPQPPSSDPKITSLLKSIASERRNLEGAKAVMRAVEASSGNEAVIQQAQNEVRSAQANIRFLEAEFEKLKLSASGPPSAPPATTTAGYNGGGYNPIPAGRPAAAGGVTAPLKIIKQGDRDRPLPPPPPGEEEVKPPKTYTNLDLLRYDAPLTGPKITRMLAQLESKLQLEEQYKTGIDKMAQAYLREGDKRLKAETDAKRFESNSKIQLLRAAKRRYEQVAEFGHVDDDGGEWMYPDLD